ncbi:MAG TPA: hypothetical protein PLT82_04930 [Candidatus Hydrogenedens sp.]|nr:hypothetical protein [Candidatus Hydrogenedens sp.]HOK09671.1 hypothetical protein [Candidatus Hydrogenedens sp.]HPP58457.1 hypothetical protein [Candidatus Hydrogenedens sp.]
MFLSPFLRRFPLIRAVTELHTAPRKYLAFTAFNVISWQCIVGPAMVLFARTIGMPADKVGLLISFMPFTTILTIFMVPLVTRVGPKNLMLYTWLIRNLIMLPIFAMPFVIAHYGNQAGWTLLITLTLGFCLARAFGSGGWLPWLHEVIPYEQRGLYFSAEAGTVQLVNVGILLSQGFFLGKNPNVNQFLVIYAVGIFGGLLSLFWMARVPGGMGQKISIQMRDFYMPYTYVLKDKTYLLFLIPAFFSLSATNWFGSVIVLYLRDILKLSEKNILIINSAGSLFIMLTAPAWGRYSDSYGSSPAILRALLCHALLVLPFIEFIPRYPWVYYLVPVLVVLITVFSAAFWTSIHRAMLNMVPEKLRIPYTNLWAVTSGLSLGITPVLAGQIIRRWDWHGFQFCFITSGVLCLICAGLCYITIKEQKPLAQPPLLKFLNPRATFTAVLEGFSISFGFPMNRNDKE